MLILGIETSCDETAVTILEGDDSGKARIRAEHIASQIDIHARFGGVVPEIASREHLAALPPMVDAVMAEAGVDWKMLDLIAVTAGPGLIGALLVGISYARAAGLANNIPVMPIHHMQAHLFAPGLGQKLPDFPFITLLASGGHTMLIHVDGVDCFELLGQTLDDAAGECFDKSARLLGLPYPGGPAIAELAEGGDARRFPLPRPMLNRDDLNFSFSGLKTAVMHIVRETPGIDHKPDALRDLAAGIEAATADVLVAKSIRACEKKNVQRLVVAGGVAANQRLRNRLECEAKKLGLDIFMPELKYCTDNAAMIAYSAFLQTQAGVMTPTEWDARPRWPLSAVLHADAPDHRPRSSP